MTKDLVVLVADKDQKAAIQGLIANPKRLGIRPIDCGIYEHPRRDSGCWKDAENVLRSQRADFANALVIFDHEGSGQEAKSVDKVEGELRKRLERNGWKDHCDVVVIAPELEIWAWSDSPVLDEYLGWKDASPDLRTQVRSRQKQLWGEEQQPKPKRPKEAMEWALKNAPKRPRRQDSSRIFEQLAQKLPFDNCKDSSFNKLLDTLRNWFPPEGGE